MIIAIDKHIKNGFGADERMIYLYIKALGLLQRYDEAYIITKNFEKIAKTIKSEILAELYLCCFKLKEAERVLSNNTFPLKDELLPVKIALRQGKIEEAKRLLEEKEKILYDDEKTIKALEKYRRIIENHYKYGAFIEIEYESFIENGNTLEPGHIVFLKNSPTEIGEISEDSKNANRPYMIWKIENNEIYMFPVTTKIENGGYRLFCQNYPNSVGDRKVKNNLCKTTIDNVLSVKDRVTEFDFNAIKRNIFKGTYGSKDENVKKRNKLFMDEFAGKPKVHDVIKFKDIKAKKVKKYFVLEELEEGYKVISCNNEETKITGLKPEIISKNQQIYFIVLVNKETIKEFLSQIEALKEMKTLKGKIVLLEEGTYIILGEEEENLIAVESGYSQSLIKPILIEKKEIKEIIGELSEDEINQIIKSVEEKDKLNIKRIKKAR